jgi:cation transport ATPase
MVKIYDEDEDNEIDYNRAEEEKQSEEYDDVLPQFSFNNTFGSGEDLNDINDLLSQFFGEFTSHQQYQPKSSRKENNRHQQYQQEEEEPNLTRKQDDDEESRTKRLQVTQERQEKEKRRRNIKFGIFASLVVFAFVPVSHIRRPKWLATILQALVVPYQSLTRWTCIPSAILMYFF